MDDPKTKKDSLSALKIAFFQGMLVALLLGHSTAFPRPQLDFQDFILYGCLCPLAIALALRKLVLQWNLLSWSILVLFGVGALSVFHSWGISQEGLISLSQMLLWLGLMVGLSIWDAEDLSAVYWTSLCLSVAAALWLLVCLSLTPWSPDGIAYLGHPTFLSHLFAVNVPILIVCATPFKSRGARLFTWATLVLLISGALACGTRSSLLALFVAALFWAKRKALNFRTALILGSAFAFALALIYATDLKLRGEPVLQRLLPDNAQSTTKEGLDRFTSGRLNLFHRTLAMIEERPLLGWGIGRYQFDHPKFGQESGPRFWTMHPHNEFLHVLAEIGWVGMLALAFAAFSFVFWIRRKKKSTSLGLPGEAAWAGVILILVEWQFSTNFINPVSRFYFALFLGTALAQFAQAASSSGRRFGPKLVFAPATALAYCLVLSHLVSLVFVRQAETSRSEFVRLEGAKAAYQLSPGSFGALYSLSSLENRIFFEPSPHTAELYRRFENVPQAYEEHLVARQKKLKAVQ